VVLSPLEPGSSEVFGTPLDEHGDAALPSHPGRGVVQDGRLVRPVQVYDVGP